jgi:RNA polymerase sigma-70 factor (ECF subfamily)
MRRAAFESAVAEHGRRVFTLAVYLLGDREEAEDVTQEVLVRLWRRGSEVDPGRLGAWLSRVTRNLCIDAVRSRSRTCFTTLTPRDVELVETAADVRPGPEASAQGSEIGSMIHGALAELPEPYRSVVVLREIQGLSYGEIGDVLDMPLNSVRVTLHRGRRKLREALREEYDHAAVV